MKLNRRSILLWTLAFVAIDIALTWVSIRTGTLRSGRSPILDLWDLAKALTIGTLLIMTARRVESHGLVVIGIAAMLVGLVGGTHLHGQLANSLLPGAGSGVGKFIVLSAAVILVVGVLFSIHDPWEHFRTIRRGTVILLLALLFVAGTLDIVGNFRGASLIEETAERLVMSFALAISLELLSGRLHTSVQAPTGSP